MSKQIIKIGTQSNDGTGDSIRDAFNKANQNFSELYSLSGAENGLYFTKNLVDTPKTLTADTLTNAASIIGVNILGNSLTNKILVAGTGISIVSTGSNIYISNTASNLFSDPAPTLSATLNGNNQYAINFNDPVNPKDLANKEYVDKTSFASSINLFVSLSGSDTNDITFGDPTSGGKGGRALAYAFKSINKACQVAEKLVAQSNLELGPDQKYITYGQANNESLIQTITTSTRIPGNLVLNVNYTGNGTNAWIENDIHPGQYVKGMTSGAIGFIDYLSNQGTNGAYESYDVKVIAQTPPKTFQANEPLMYGNPVVLSNITIIVESGIYEEHLPIKVPANTSIRGDEFRRVIIRPKAGLASTSPWVGTYFYRDKTFDGLSVATTGTLSVNGNGYFGYHYLVDPTKPYDPITNPGKNNELLDVLLMNDQTILRAVSGQGHGGFMVVLDPEGQILTKSPYIQNCSSIARSLNTQTFAGGMYIDGMVGNLQAYPTNTSTFFTGTTTISVTGLTIRQPQVPCRFVVNGVGYEVDYVEGWSTDGNAILHLNPNNPGGVSYYNGIIPVNSGTGYTSAPTVQFSSPQSAGGVVAQGTATVVGGVLTQINISNPGSGYTATPTVTLTGGGYATPATVTLSSSTIQKGFIGNLPSVIEIGTAGYRSALAADFTQLNDLGYGVVVTNLAFSELVSVFTYFCHAGYYANNGAQIGSSNGAIKYGDYALISNGSDTLEVPIPIRLSNSMITTATVVSQSNTWGLYTINTASDTTLYVSNWAYVPNSQSIMTVDHGTATYANGQVIGRQDYTISSANTVTNTSTIVQLNLSTAAGSLGGLLAPIADGTSVIIRANKTFTFSGVDTTTITRPGTALDFTESQSIAYQVLTYDTAGQAAGVANVALKEPFNYISLIPYTTATTGTTVLHIVAPSTSTGITTAISDSQRLNNAVLSADTTDNYIFGWNNQIHTITGFNWLGNNTATITITPALTAVVPANVSNNTLYAGLQSNRPAEISTRISLLRATGHDFVDVGTGGRESSNIPNDIYGPPRIPRNSSNEVIQSGRGRVFVTATDQNGNFRVGDLFEINQGTGEATLSASISLTGITGLGFESGVIVHRFDDSNSTMNPAGHDVVPTQFAVTEYVDRRLGLTVAGGVRGDKLDSGYLDLTGIQAMTGALNMGSTATGYIYNLQTPPYGINTTATYYATNKVYVDTNDALRVAKAGDTMSGTLILSRDPVYTDPMTQATTRHYVDQYRQVSVLSDVALNNVADTDLLMFAGSLSVNTATSQPIWNATRQIINVTNSSTSNIAITRSGNTAALSIKAGNIIDSMISSSAAIAQTKLALNTANVFGNQAGSVGNLGVSAFDSAFFKANSGFISLAAGTGNTPNAVIVSDGSGIVSWQSIATVVSGATVSTSTYAVQLQTARTINGVSFNGTANLTNVPVANGLTAGSYLLSNNLNAFTGSTATTFSVNASTDTTANTIVARDSSGNITANGWTGNLHVTGQITATNSITSFGADVAEKYIADADYEPGTVVVFGGANEITISTEHMDRRVAGVISTDPGYLMNVGSSGLPVALQGRVPCKVVGLIYKGDMMISSGTPGVAMAENNPKMGTVIGKALEDYHSTEVGTIEVVVGRL